MLQFLAEVVIFADLLTDIAVAVTLSSAEENWLYVTNDAKSRSYV